MKVGWLIDAELFPEYREELAAAIRDQGHDVRLVRTPSPPFRWDDVGCSYRETFPADACVVAHGDIELVARIYRERRWTPGAFATIEKFACSWYFCRYGRFLLNRDYLMLPFGELARCQQFLFDTLGREGAIFVRPDSPLKLFTGQLARQASFAADLEFMAFYEFPPESLVVVSSPKDIITEWRFVVVEGQVVAGSQYKSGGKLDYRPQYDPEAFELAKRIAAAGEGPDPAWVMDICRTAEGACHLLEMGGFSFADLYACNKADVVAAVSAAAIAVYTKSIERATT